VIKEIIIDIFSSHTDLGMQFEEFKAQIISELNKE
jgi:hypothetical protein